MSWAAVAGAAVGVVGGALISNRASRDARAAGERSDEAAERIANEQAAIGREQLAEDKRRYEEFKPSAQRAMDQQFRIAETSEQRASQQWQEYLDTYQPIERQMAKEAMAEGSPEQQETEAAKARAQVAGSHEAGRASTSRDLARAGVNPNSGRFADFTLRSGLSQSSGEAGAMNNARTEARTRGIALRSGVSQFGRGMPQTGIASDSLALSGGRAAASTGLGSLAAGSNISSAAAPWYGGAAAGNQYAGSNQFLRSEYQGEQARRGAAPFVSLAQQGVSQWFNRPPAQGPAYQPDYGIGYGSEGSYYE